MPSQIARTAVIILVTWALSVGTMAGIQTAMPSLASVPISNPKVVHGGIEASNELRLAPVEDWTQYADMPDVTLTIRTYEDSDQ